MRPSLVRPVLASMLVLSSLACGDGTGPETPAEVTLGFVAAGSEVASAAATSPVATDGSLAMVDLAGTNGTLILDELQIVVDEFKLERSEGACEAQEEEECATFELPPYFLHLPLDGLPIDIGSSPVAEGTYGTLKLETKDLTSSGGEDETETESLADEVLAAFPDWPGSASLRVAGSFAPEDGSEPRPFVVYFHAEVKVELSFDPPLMVSGGDGPVGVVVEVDPKAWLILDDASVRDLSELDFETTGEVVDFEAKMADGFTRIEVDG